MAMREIKFRAWAGTEMIKPCNLWDRGDSPIEWLNSLPYPDSILMQYTGLTDKNGKEIYEGDIVKFDKGKWNDVCGASQDKPCLLAIKWGTYGWLPFEEEGYDGVIMFGESNCEVIGNVHQNPELTGGAGIEN